MTGATLFNAEQLTEGVPAERGTVIRSYPLPLYAELNAHGAGSHASGPGAGSASGSGASRRWPWARRKA